MRKQWTTVMHTAEETVMRCGDEAQVVGGNNYHFPGKSLCSVEDTGNGYIAFFESHSSSQQDYYVCLDYAQAYDLILGLSAFKKELGFTE